MKGLDVVAVVRPLRRAEAELQPFAAAPRRVCLISEHLPQAPDEGTNKFAASIARALAHDHDLLALATRTSAPLAGVRTIPVGPTFLGRELRQAIRGHNPEVIIYAPTASTTFWAFLRSRVLKACYPTATVALIGLQGRRHSPLQQVLLRHVAPDLVCVQSSQSRQYLEGLGCRVGLLPSGVDVETFHPVAPGRRRELRERYGLEPTRPVALHVGHLKAGRGVQILGDLAAHQRCQVVLAASSSTEQDSALARYLRQAGVVVFDEYQPHIEELYQLADCYVFPVLSADDSIEVPLSVLEAMACDLPVVTTRQGGLPELFEDTACSSLVFADTPGALVSETLRLCQAGTGGTRRLALPYSWDAVARGLLDSALLVGSVG